MTRAYRTKSRQELDVDERDEMHTEAISDDAFIMTRNEVEGLTRARLHVLCSKVAEIALEDEG